MLEYRSIDYKKDIPEVVELIKNNLQPEYTEQFLNWKHTNNYFGPSYSMLAVLNNEIVGVVFYMRYDYRSKQKKIKCIRPVDGCTTANMRGKGIFKKLMVSCLDKYKNNYDLILATPNVKSLPEVLKLGYTSSSSYGYKFGISLSLFFSKKIIITDLDPRETSDELLDPNHLIAGNSLNFILWRYKSEEYKKLKIEINDHLCYLVFRIDKIKGIRTLILCDFFGESKYLNDVLKAVCKEENIYFIYFLKNLINRSINLGFVIDLRKALFTYKENLDFKLNEELVISLGDLEGKL